VAAAAEAGSAADIAEEAEAEEAEAEEAEATEAGAAVPASADASGTSVAPVRSSAIT
jgi:hypothetical protein